LKGVVAMVSEELKQKLQEAKENLQEAQKAYEVEKLRKKELQRNLEDAYAVFQQLLEEAADLI